MMVWTQNPVAGRCEASVPDRGHWHWFQCGKRARFSVWNGHHRFEVCGTHKNAALRSGGYTVLGEEKPRRVVSRAAMGEGPR